MAAQRNAERPFCLSSATEQRLANEEVKRLAKNKRLRDRYATDEEYRKKMNEKSKKWGLENPEKTKESRDKCRKKRKENGKEKEYRDRYNAAVNADPERLRHKKDMMKFHNDKRWNEIKNNEELKKKHNEERRKKYAENCQDPEYRERINRNRRERNARKKQRTEI